MLASAPLQMIAVAGVIIAGKGFTVTVIVYGLPEQVPVVDVGVTRYSTDPAVVLLGLVSVCAMVLPEPDVAPAILPLIVPIVQLNVLPALEVSAILVVAPLQIVALLPAVTAGVGLTVTVIVYGDAAGQLPVVDVGVTKY
jgi:hypothetical protein